MGYDLETLLTELAGDNGDLGLGVGDAGRLGVSAARDVARAVLPAHAGGPSSLLELIRGAPLSR